MRKENFLWVLLNVNIFCVYLQENSTGEDAKTWWCNRVMFHLEVLGLFSWSILVSTLALWNFESFCICLPSFGFGVGGVRCYKKKQNRHLFLVALLPCASAASPAVSYPLLCSLLWNVFLLHFMNSHTDALLKVSTGLQWTFQSLLTVADLIALEDAGYALVVLQCWEVQGSST